MNKEQFFKYIDNPDKLDDSSKNEVFQLIKDYPYFQSVHLLYIKNLFNQKDIKFSSQLKIASLYSANRNTLYKLLNCNENISGNECIGMDDLSLPVINVDSIIESDLLPGNSTLDENFNGNDINDTENSMSKIPELLTNVCNEKVILKPDNVNIESNSSNVIIDGNFDKTENNIKIETGWMPESEQITPVKKENIADKVLKRVEEQQKLRESKLRPLIDHAIIETEKTNQLVSNQDNVIVPFIKSEDEIFVENISPVLIKLNEEDSVNTKVKDENIQNDLSYPVKADEIASSDFKESNSQENHKGNLETDIIYTDDSEKTVILNNINEEIKNDEYLLFAEWLELCNKKNEIKPKGEFNNQIHLIDNFIKEDPKIKAKTNTKVGNNLFSDSYKEGEDFITETLAIIYKKQGYYEKAINVLNKLSLKYPEKSIYFANQINEINNLNNNKS